MAIQIIFVWWTPVRRDWLIHLIGMASNKKNPQMIFTGGKYIFNQVFFPKDCHKEKNSFFTNCFSTNDFHKKKKCFFNLSNRRFLLAVKTTVVSFRLGI